MIPFLYENQYRFIPPLDDGIQPWYIIYTDGRIYSTKRNKFVVYLLITFNDYPNGSWNRSTGVGPSGGWKSLKSKWKASKYKKEGGDLDDDIV